MAELLFISAGSGAVGSPDRFAPKNVPAGDSPVPYSAGGFVYFPDTGDRARPAGLAAPRARQELWTRVAEWGCRELGLEARYADKWNAGRPVPREWAPGGVGRY